jgi:hypothetical protein
MLFSESCTETLLVDNLPSDRLGSPFWLVDNLPSDRPGSPLEVRLLLETNNAQETTVNNETNEFIAEKYTDNNRKENTDQNDYDEHRKTCTANQMQQLKDRNIFRNANSVFRISYRVFRWTWQIHSWWFCTCVCEASIDLYPDDVPHDTNCFPVEVRANRDCLPSW